MQLIVAGIVEEIPLTIITLVVDPQDLELKAFRCMNPQCSRIVTQFTGKIGRVIEGDEPLNRPFVLFQCRICKRKYVFREL